MASQGEQRTLPRYPLLALLHPREQTRLVMLLVPVGLLLWGVAALVVGMPIWGATTVTLGVLLVLGVLKWWSDESQKPRGQGSRHGLYTRERLLPGHPWIKPHRSDIVPRPAGARFPVRFPCYGT